MSRFFYDYYIKKGEIANLTAILDNADPAAAAMQDDLLLSYLTYNSDKNSDLEVNCSDPQQLFHESDKYNIWACLLYTQAKTRATLGNETTDTNAQELWARLNQSSPQHVSSIITTCLVDYCANLDLCSGQSGNAACHEEMLMSGNDSLSITGMDVCLLSICQASERQIPDSDIFGIGVICAISMQLALTLLSFICLLFVQMWTFNNSRRGKGIQKGASVLGILNCDSDSIAKGFSLDLREVVLVLQEEIILAGIGLLAGVVIAGSAVTTTTNGNIHILVVLALALTSHIASINLVLFHGRRSILSRSLICASFGLCIVPWLIPRSLKSVSMVARANHNVLADQCWGFELNFCSGDLLDVKPLVSLSGLALFPTVLMALNSDGTRFIGPKRLYVCLSFFVIDLSLAIFLLVWQRQFISTTWSFGQIVAATAVLPTLISAAHSGLRGAPAAKTEQLPPGLRVVRETPSDKSGTKRTTSRSKPAVADQLSGGTEEAGLLLTSIDSRTADTERPQARSTAIPIPTDEDTIEFHPAVSVEDVTRR